MSKVCQEESLSLFFVGLKCDRATLPRTGKPCLGEYQEWRVPYGVFFSVFQRQLQGKWGTAYPQTLK